MVIPGVLAVNPWEEASGLDPEAVHEQFRSFEAAPPASLEWDQLSRTERLLVSERVVRTDRSVEDFDIAT
jgi:hypothetical protein